MDLQTIASITGIVSSIAVTATLVVLIVSIRQNTQSQKILAVQSLTSAITAINVPAMESSEMGAALANVTKDWNAGTREQRIIAHYFLFSIFKLGEAAWYQRKSGALETGQWDGWERLMRLYYHSAGVREAWWPHRGYAYSPEFQKYLLTTQPLEGVVTLETLFGPKGE